MLVFADDRKSSQKYQGVVVLVSANPEILSKISRGGGGWRKNPVKAEIAQITAVLFIANSNTAATPSPHNFDNLAGKTWN